MCCSDRKIPAAIVGTLGCITMFLSFFLLSFAVRFNNEGLTTDLGQSDDYANQSFYMLGGVAAATFLCSISACFVCCCKYRWCTIIFGFTLLPVSIAILAFGMTLTSVSHTNLEEIQEFCSEYSADGFSDMSKRDQGAVKLREGIFEIDTKLGELVNSGMCSHICPCDMTEKKDMDL